MRMQIPLSSIEEQDAIVDKELSQNKMYYLNPRIT